MDEKPEIVSTMVQLLVYEFNNYETIEIPLLHQERNLTAAKEVPYIFAVQWYDQLVAYKDHAGITHSLFGKPINLSPVYYLDPIEIVDDLLGVKHRSFIDLVKWKKQGVPLEWKIANNLRVYPNLEFSHSRSLFRAPIKVVP